MRLSLLLPCLLTVAGMSSAATSAYWCWAARHPAPAPTAPSATAGPLAATAPAPAPISPPRPAAAAPVVAPAAAPPGAAAATPTEVAWAFGRPETHAGDDDRPSPTASVWAPAPTAAPAAASSGFAAAAPPAGDAAGRQQAIAAANPDAPPEGAFDPGAPVVSVPLPYLIEYGGLPDATYVDITCRRYHLRPIELLTLGVIAQSCQQPLETVITVFLGPCQGSIEELVVAENCDPTIFFCPIENYTGSGRFLRSYRWYAQGHHGWPQLTNAEYEALVALKIGVVGEHRPLEPILRDLDEGVTPTRVLAGLRSLPRVEEPVHTAEPAPVEAGRPAGAGPVRGDTHPAPSPERLLRQDPAAPLHDQQPGDLRPGVQERPARPVAESPAEASAPTGVRHGEAPASAPTETPSWRETRSDQPLGERSQGGGAPAGEQGERFAPGSGSGQGAGAGWSTPTGMPGR